jgi:hypothetical protein
MNKANRTDRTIDWLRDHPLFFVGLFAFYALVLGISWYLSQLIAKTPNSPFIYDI